MSRATRSRPEKACRIRQRSRCRRPGTNAKTAFYDPVTLTPTLAALFGSIATMIAIFGGGLAVEAYKGRRDRMGLALALAGAIDACSG